MEFCCDRDYQQGEQTSANSRQQWAPGFEVHWERGSYNLLCGYFKLSVAPLEYSP